MKIKKISVSTRLLIFSLIFGLIGLGSIIFIILISVIDLVERPIAAQILVFLVAIASTIGFIFLLNLYFERKQFVRQLNIENSYSLGNQTSFYNYDAFKNKSMAYAKRFSLRDYHKYIIAFTCGSLKNTASNSTMVQSMNYYVSEFVDSLFFDAKFKFPTRRNVYGFNRGIFLIFLPTNDEKVLSDLINLINDNVYKIVAERKLKVYAQPFFGIKEVSKNENIVEAIEDAMLVRNISENNFETYTFFSTSFKKDYTVDDIRDFEYAIEHDEFLVYYQPKYSMKEKKFVSAEALARWNSSKYGFLTPGMFIDKAEFAGMISLIDNYIFEKSLKEMSEQRRRGRRVLPVSVNFSIYEFYSKGFIDHVVNLLNKYNIPPNLVEIEITETTSQANQFLSISIIKKLKDLGIRVLMDDFGVGYSGIDNLRKIPFDAIKIDKSFTDLLVSDEKTKSIVKLIIDLGHVNDVEVIIEGVDSQKQVDILRRMKIDTIQGFYYAKPMPLDAYDDFLKNNQFEKEEDK